jgi:hypothetical protein
MRNFKILALAVLLLTMTAKAYGQEADEIKRLKERVEMLEAKLKLVRCQGLVLG